MAVTFVAASTANSASGTSGTPSEPTGTTENDVVVAWAVINQSEDGTWTDPADFIELHNSTKTVNPNGHVYLGYKVRGSDAGSGYAFSYSGTAASITVNLATFRGVDTTTPLDVTFASGSHYVEASNAHNTAAGAITTVNNNAMVVLLQSMLSTISGAAGPPSGYTEQFDVLGTAAQDPGAYVCTKIVATAGLETPGVFTHTDDGVGSDPDPAVYTIALREAAASGIVLPTFQGPNLNSFIRD